MVDIFEEHNLVPENTFDFKQINKTALGNVSRAVVEKVDSGDEDPLEVYIKAKAMQEVAGNIIKEVKSLAIDEASKYGKGDSKLLGCEFIVKNGVSRYSFDHDDSWCELTSQIDELSAERKIREKQMIEATKYAVLADKDGEVIPPANVTNGGGTVLSITIPKK